MEDRTSSGGVEQNVFQVLRADGPIQLALQGDVYLAAFFPELPRFGPLDEGLDDVSQLGHRNTQVRGPLRVHVDLELRVAQLEA